jgi:hypothetical protein
MSIYKKRLIWIVVLLFACACKAKKHATTLHPIINEVHRLKGDTQEIVNILVDKALKTTNASGETILTQQRLFPDTVLITGGPALFKFFPKTKDRRTILYVTQDSVESWADRMHAYWNTDVHFQFINIDHFTNNDSGYNVFMHNSGGKVIPYWIRKKRFIDFSDTNVGGWDLVLNFAKDSGYLPRTIYYGKF